MTTSSLQEYDELVLIWTERGAKAVKKGNWLDAGDAYKTAAFYQAIAKTIRQEKNR